MKITIEKKYICIPTNMSASSKILCFYDSETKDMVLDLECRLDMIDPNYTAYVDVSRFIGRVFECETIPSMDFRLEQVDVRPLDNLYSEPYRPHSHFSAAIGFINDPNGMIKYGDTYHMFFQYNPAGMCVSNMSWGHAVSRDLLHWKELDVALFPDETGTKYSGSAIEDIHNVSGLQKDPSGPSPILLFYTAAGDRGLIAGGKKRTQGLAYSVDGGETFRLYEGNPVIDHVEGYNRDPKVVWVEEIERFLLMLYMGDDRYCLFSSKNLLDWENMQEISIEGEHECPDLYSYVVDGEKYWVLTGASDIYVVGRFVDGRFASETEPKRLCPFRCSYAGQSLSGIDDGRVVRVTCEQLSMPLSRTNRQMSIPMEMTLVREHGEFFLTANPIRELSALYLTSERFEPGALTDPFAVSLKERAYDIHLKGEFEGDLQIRIFGQILKVNEKDNCITFGRAVIPTSQFRESKDIRILVDRCSLELFVDGGKQFVALSAVCDYNLPYIELSSKSGSVVTSLELHELDRIYK